jgi:hypothetical protein
VVLPEYHSSPDAKIDDDLVKLAREQRTEPVSVIVELEVPRPRVDIRQEGAETAGRPWRVTSSDEDRMKAQQVVERAREFLADFTDKPPVWLSASQAFVVNAAPDQLATIAASPLVRRISWNRVRR